MNPMPPAPSQSGPASEKSRAWSARWLILLLGGALLVCFWRVASGLDAFFTRDSGVLGYPWSYYLADSLRHGELPLWNPYSHCGTPFMAQWGNWYPGSLLGALLPMPWWANFQDLIHLLLGGLGVYWLSRRWGAGGYAATVAGFAYAFNGASLSCLEWGNYIASLAWMPWVIGWTREAWQTGRPRAIAVASVLAALQLLTATPELTLLLWTLLGALWIIDLVEGPTPRLRSAARLAAVVGLAGGIAMVQMLPFLDLLAHSQRSRLSATGSGAMPGWGWANLLVPLFHAFQTSQGQWFQSGQVFLASYYLGIGVLALAALGVIQRPTRRNLVLAAAALLCWVLALGSQGRVYDWLRALCPWIGVARFPVKFAIFPALLLPLLAAGGIDSLLTEPNRLARTRLLSIASALLTAAGLALWFAHRYPFEGDDWHSTVTNTAARTGLFLAMIGALFLLAGLKSNRGRIVAGLVVLAVLPVDALTHSPRLCPTLAAAEMSPGLWTASGQPAPPAPGQGRILITPEAEQLLLRRAVSDPVRDFAFKRLAEWSNLNLLDHLPKVPGAMTLRPRDYDRLEHHLYYTPGTECGEGLLDFLSVAWASSSDNPAVWVPRTNYLPVLTGGQRPVFVDDAHALTAITALDFNPREVVYLPEQDRGAIGATNRAACVIRSTRFTSGTVEAEIDLAGDGMLVLSQSYYHLWRAFVDGRPVPLRRANLGFQALEAPAGKHQVRLVYTDPNLKIGGLISLASLGVCAWLGRRSAKR